MRRYSSVFDEAVLKHLEMIQGNISRMGRNSFLLKGWSVTLVAAIIALSVRNPNALFVLIALFPALVFWGLDAFYLQQERLFRRLYQGTVEGKIDPFSMDTTGHEKHESWSNAICSRSVIPFHVAVVGIVALVFFSLLLLQDAGGADLGGGEETTELLTERR